ncbi:MAG: acetyl-CoA acetyltransferase [Candidatus Binatia bacterium]|nr:acetyl-CoA acetyltransferase [Candidatus Binatia bacterium]
MAGSIKDRVAIIGMGCTKFGERWGSSCNDMIIEAAYEAYEDAGVDPKDIEAGWVGTLGGTTGMTISKPLKLQYIPITRCENGCATGSDAFRNAAYSIAAGIYDMVLVVGYEKLKDSGFSGLAIPTSGSGGGLNDFAGGVQATTTAPGMFATMATKYFERYGLSPEEGKKMIGMVSVKSHANGALNPKAHFQNEVSIEQVMKAPIISWPLGLFDCCGVSDGASAAILVRADRAKEFRSDPVYIKALQISTGGENRFRDDYDYTHVEEIYRSGVAAYKEAGVTNPREEISMAEVHDCFSITEAIFMEDLQFSPRGRVREDIENGFFTLEGGLPVQPDGGLKCFGHPIGASGVRMIYEMYKQIQGKAGQRQIKNPQLGLTSNLGGEPPGCCVSTIIVGK